jgi:hypothetical protein
MVRLLKEGGFSRSTIHNAFSTDILPRWGIVEQIVECLAAKVPGATTGDLSVEFHTLWMDAKRAALADGASSDPKASSGAVVEASRAAEALTADQQLHHGEDGSTWFYAPRAGDHAPAVEPLPEHVQRSTSDLSKHPRPALGEVRYDDLLRDLRFAARRQLGADAVAIMLGRGDGDVAGTQAPEPLAEPVRRGEDTRADLQMLTAANMIDLRRMSGDAGFSSFDREVQVDLIARLTTQFSTESEAHEILQVLSRASYHEHVRGLKWKDAEQFWVDVLSALPAQDLAMILYYVSAKMAT